MPALQPIKGATLALLTLSLSLATFMNVLDVSIANVAIPTIAGDLAVSADQGTWVITSFSVSMAIFLPLTGWLAKRFGEVRLFTAAVALFTLASCLCGLATSLPSLIVFRVLQGAVAGPMIPLSQSLLLANYPDHKKPIATALWAMTVVSAPVFGPILGGWITDNYTWPWIFYINIPIGIFACYITWQILRKRETATERLPIDVVGLILLVIGVGSLQILLDKGNNLDWFHSNTIVTLAIVSVVTLSIFIVWELTEKYPVVDLTLFKRRNFTIGVIAMSFGYLAFFGSVVIFPLWLQTQMGYTATWAGLAAAPIGVLSFILSPIVGRLVTKIDLRLIVTFGFAVFILVSFWSTLFTVQASIQQLVGPRFVQGIGMACYFIPIIAVTLSGLPAHRLASASGLSNFLRILAGSFGTSLSTNMWARREAFHHNQLTENINIYNPINTEAMHQLHQIGLSDAAGQELLVGQITHQAFMLATNDFYWLCGWLFLFLSILIWFAKPPFVTHKIDAGAH